MIVDQALPQRIVGRLCWATDMLRLPCWVSYLCNRHPAFGRWFWGE